MPYKKDFNMNRNFNSLFSVLIHNDQSAIISRKDGIDINWRNFQSDIRKLYQKLCSEPVHNKYLVYCKSSYEFAVALFSVWHKGSVCVLPPNNSKEVLKMFESYVDAFITDQPDCDIKLEKIAPLQYGEEGCEEFNPLPENEIMLELFTSGTTGERKCIRKTIANLNSELFVLNNVFGSVLENTRTFSTVSHQHIYGLLHKILLPICTNRLFIDETYFYPEKMIADMIEGDSKSVIISGPAHLKLLPELVNLKTISKYCKAIFSSGSLLDTESSHRLSSQSGIYPIEVFGSTETGGVAWRSQTIDPGSEKWTPFPSIEIKKNEEGFLQVKSPFVFLEDPQDQWFTMGDIVEICSDNRFLLCGRGDRIVKIGEKRVSLEEMEKTLKSFPAVNSCKIFPITRKHGNYDRTVLACVVETSEAVNSKESKSLVAELKSLLLQYFTQTLVPKYWRFVQKIPLDPQGKTSMEELRKLFNSRTGNV